MKRRDFMKNLGLTATAVAVAPVVSCAREDKASGSNAVTERNDKGEYVERYGASSAVRSGIALGGIGAGYVELRKDGQFYNWSIFNNQPLGTGPVFKLKTWPRDNWEQSLQFFIVRYQVEGEDPKMKLLQISNTLGEAGQESIAYYLPQMTAISNIEYKARYPFIDMKFTDPEMPFEIEMEAFTPFIPHDVKNSSLPGAYFNFKIKATGKKNVNVMLIASQRNLVGYDTADKYFVGELIEKPGYKFFSQSAEGMDTNAPTYGTMGLASLSDDTTYYLGWEHKHPYYENLLFENKLANINDTDNRNKVDKATGKKYANMGWRNKDQRCFSSLAVTRDLQPGGAFDHSFVMAWDFPNNYGSYNDPNAKKDFEEDYASNQLITKNMGHYHSNFFSGAASVAEYLVAQKQELTARSKQFLTDFYASTVEVWLLDQINSQLNTFITSSTLTKNMVFGIREGMTPEKSWGPNTTSDVSLYASISTVSLFPELQKTAMKAHRHVQTPKGEIAHGLGYDLDFTQNGTWGVYERVDLPGNYIQMVLRDYFLTNDKAYLKDMWPSVKMAIEYIINERDKDGDQMPDMEGIMCSYDNFPMYGLASYIQSQWLCSLASAVKAADAVGDTEASAKYSAILEKGSKLMDEKLWNGTYYRLSNDYNGEKGVDEGCLTDQIIGQWVAHQSGLGYLFNKEHVHKALQTVMQMSFKDSIGLRNCSWPEHPYLYPIHKSDLWVDQANTPWTGVELAFASFLIYEGLVEEGKRVIKSVDDRYRKNGLYWDHQEFGGHYLRPMSAWGIVNALLGLGIQQGTLSFNPKTGAKARMFFATPDGTAHYVSNSNKVSLEVKSGSLKCSKLTFENAGLTEKATVTLGSETLQVSSKMENGVLVIDLGKEVEVKAGTTLTIA